MLSRLQRARFPGLSAKLSLSAACTRIWFERRVKLMRQLLWTKPHPHILTMLHSLASPPPCFVYRSMLHRAPPIKVVVLMALFGYVPDKIAADDDTCADHVGASTKTCSELQTGAGWEFNEDASKGLVTKAKCGTPKLKSNTVSFVRWSRKFMSKHRPDPLHPPLFHSIHSPFKN